VGAKGEVEGRSSSYGREFPSEAWSWQKELTQFRTFGGISKVEIISEMSLDVFKIFIIIGIMILRMLGCLNLESIAITLLHFVCLAKDCTMSLQILWFKRQVN